MKKEDEAQHQISSLLSQLRENAAHTQTLSESIATMRTEFEAKRTQLEHEVEVSLPLPSLHVPSFIVQEHTNTLFALRHSLAEAQSMNLATDESKGLDHGLFPSHPSSLVVVRIVSCVWCLAHLICHRCHAS